MRLQIDGANALKRFFYITLPGISPAIFFQLIMGIINNFQYFTQAYLMIGSSTGGGLNVVSGGAENSLLFYALYLYQNAFNLLNGQSVRDGLDLVCCCGRCDRSRF